jgi:hypothetical protein
MYVTCLKLGRMVVHNKGFYILKEKISFAASATVASCSMNE